MNIFNIPARKCAMAQFILQNKHIQNTHKNCANAVHSTIHTITYTTENMRKYCERISPISYSRSHVTAAQNMEYGNTTRNTLEYFYIKHYSCRYLRPNANHNHSLPTIRTKTSTIPFPFPFIKFHLKYVFGVRGWSLTLSFKYVKMLFCIKFNINDYPKTFTSSYEIFLQEPDVFSESREHGK
jgi:hypothetical protein